MIITCPNCSTRYTVDKAAIGDGKNTRCSHCQHTWFVNVDALTQSRPAVPRRMQPPLQPNPYAGQMMPGMVPGQMVPGMVPGQMMPGMVPGGMVPGQMMPGMMPGQMPQGTPQGALQGLAVDPAAAVAPQPAPQPAPEPEPEPEPELEPEPEPVPEPEPELEPEPEPEAEAEELLSAEQLDDMFGDDDEPEPMASLVANNSNNDDEIDSLDGLEDIPEPDPIPQVFTGGEDGDEDGNAPQKRSLVKVIGGAVSSVLLLVVLVGFFGKGFIMEKIPASNGIYEMIGLGKKLGEGLNIQGIKRAYETDGGEEVLVVRGKVLNVTDKIIDVPMIKIVLKDSDDKAVSTIFVAPLKSQLKGRNALSFKGVIKKPSALARKVIVDFGKAEKTPSNPDQVKTKPKE